MLRHRFLLALVVASIAAWAAHQPVRASRDKQGPKQSDTRMSAMGRSAAHKVAVINALDAGAASTGKDFEKAGDCVNTPDCEGADDAPPDDGPAETQSETSIAVDSTGQHIVIGFNDFRGFANNPLSVSGFKYSDDGGVTFVDGGQLPSPGDQAIGTTRLPQVLGDPDVKYVGDCTFIYSSILIAKFSATRAVQTMGVHRSTDCGHTWQGPFEVTPATNPNGLVNAAGSPRDAADKEFVDVDPETSRVIMSWSNFTPVAAGGVEISTTYSDNIRATPPTWSARRIVAATEDDGQGSIPRFAGGRSPNAYVAWSRFPDAFKNNIGFARSTDNGATWSAPRSITSDFTTMDLVLGNDRSHNFPSMAVDRSNSRFRGNIYVVYAQNNSEDGADIAFQMSANEGATFSSAVLLDSRPGNDRPQWYPAVSVDSATGRVHVFYYDQGIASSGDLTEVSHLFSDDGGRHWRAPQPLMSRPFHAGWGNDTGQPNLGDYIQVVAQNGDAFFAYALASRPPGGFTDGQPTSASMTVPDAEFSRVHQAGDDEGEDGDGGDGGRRALTLNIADVATRDSGGNGFIDPGDTVAVKIALRNYATNPLYAHNVGDVSAVLSTTTPGVAVVRARSKYEDIRPGATQTNRSDFVLRIDPAFVPGTTIELALQVSHGDAAPATLLQSVFTGTPHATPLLTENFNGAAAGSLPAGWSAVHAGGANTVPWTTSSTFCGTTSNAAFHQNAADGPSATTNTRFERLFSPLFVVPGNAEYVTIDMDVCYDTEDEPALRVQAYDGFLLRVTDQTPGRLLRSVLAEAFEDAFTTGTFFHYPKHLPRSGNGAYFQDMSAWAGDSQGFKHVRMRLPGMAGSTAQLRFEFTQDAIATCADVRPGHACGVSFDNLVVSSVRSVP